MQRLFYRLFHFAEVVLAQPTRSGEELDHAVLRLAFRAGNFRHDVGLSPRRLFGTTAALGHTSVPGRVHP